MHMRAQAGVCMRAVQLLGAAAALDAKPSCDSSPGGCRAAAAGPSQSPWQWVPALQPVWRLMLAAACLAVRAPCPFDQSRAHVAAGKAPAAKAFASCVRAAAGWTPRLDAQAGRPGRRR